MFDANSNNNYGYQNYNSNPNGMPQMKQESSLTNEEWDQLAKNGNPFSLALTETDRIRGICNHRTKDGLGDTLTMDEDGRVRCTLCNYVFEPLDGSIVTKEEIREDADRMIDILQTIKMLYLDLPIQTQREFFQIIPLIDKVPELFDLAVKNFSKHENANFWGYRNNGMGTMSAFQMLSGIFNNGGYNGYPQQGQPQNNNYYNPQQGQQMQNPYYDNAPMGSVPPTNGFGYNYGQPMPNNGYQAQANGYQYTPNQQAQQPYQQQTPPVQPDQTKPTESEATTDGSNVNATASFTS